MVFTIAATAVSALLFGLAPAWQIARMDTNEILKAAAAPELARQAEDARRAGGVRTALA